MHQVGFLHPEVKKPGEIIQPNMGKKLTQDLNLRKLFLPLAF